MHSSLFLSWCEICFNPSGFDLPLLEEHIMSTESYLLFVLATILLLTLGEMGVALFRKKVWNYKDSAANLGIYFGGLVVDKLLSNVIGAAALVSVSQFAFASVELTWISAALLLLGMDFIYYWKHRWDHEIRFFWAHHSVHHSSNHFNLSTALRVGWIGPFYQWIYFIPPVLIGFDPIVVLLTYKVILVGQFWVHSESIGKLGWLENVMNSPSNHRVHHGSDDIYIDKFIWVGCSTS